MKTVKEYLANLRPGDEFLILDLMKALDTDSLTKECYTLEDLKRVEGSVFYLGSGAYKRMYASTDPFIKQIRESYRKGDAGTGIRAFVRCWLKYIPFGSEFRVEDVAAFCPIILADKSIAKYLNEYAKEGIVEKQKKNGKIFYKRIKDLEPKEIKWNAIQQLFIDFLKSKGLISNFSEYLMRSDMRPFSKLSLEDLLTGKGSGKTLPEYWISRTFRWGNSTEGYGFWQKTNIEWLLELIKFMMPTVGKTLAEVGDYANLEDFAEFLKQISIGLREKCGFTDCTKCQ